MKALSPETPVTAYSGKSLYITQSPFPLFALRAEILFCLYMDIYYREQ